MDGLKLRISGAGDTRRAADELQGLLGEGCTVTSVAPAAEEAGRKELDPVAVTALILSIPGAVLAVMQIADRIRARKKAEQLIEVAGRLTVEHRVVIHLTTPTGPVPLDRLSPDRLLELANPTEGETAE